MTIDATFWVAVSFFIFVGVLIYFKIPQKVNNAMNSKIKETKNELDEAEKLKDEAKNILSDYENKLSHATNDATTIISSAKEKNEKDLIIISEKFYQSIENRKKTLSQKINQMKEDAIKEVKNASVKITMRAVEKVIKNSMDNKKLDRLYNDSLNEARSLIKKQLL